MLGTRRIVRARPNVNIPAGIPDRESRIAGNVQRFPGAWRSGGESAFSRLDTEFVVEAARESVGPDDNQQDDHEEAGYAAGILERLSQPIRGGFVARLKQFYIRYVYFALSRDAKPDLFNAMITHAGMRLSAKEALDQIYLTQSDDGRHPNDPIAYVVRDWRYNFTENSMPLGSAAAKWLTKEEVVLINAGAGTPRFLESLEHCQFIMENRGKIRKELRKALFWPMVSILMAFALPVAFVKVLAPTLKVMPNFHLTGSEKITIAVGQYIIHDWYVVAFGLAALIGGILSSMPRVTGRIRVIMDKIPPWGFYRVLQGSNFMLTMAALTSSGVSMADAMRKIRENSLTPYMRERVTRTLEHMETEGDKLGTALWRTGLDFPDHRTVINLRSFESSPEFSHRLKYMATRAVERNTEAITKQARWLVIGITLLTGYIIIGVVNAIQAVIMAGASMH